MRLTILFVLLNCFISNLQAQRQPEGAYNDNRTRTYDILHYKAELSFDFEKRKVTGRATLELVPLRTTDSISLDAINMNISRVLDEQDQAFSFRSTPTDLIVTFKDEMTVEDTLTLSISYSCFPKAGVYFMPAPDKDGAYFISTYGEDGLHANWLPIYSDMNDRFSTEMIVTVPASYAAISNGVLLSEKSQGRNKTFHWLQQLPHPNYLISIYVGEFDKGELPRALGEIPLNYWVPKGKLEKGAYAFRNTTKMIEFFSRRLDYPYRWDKYDQIAIPDYAIGAMEHTGVTGHRESILRTAQAPVDFSPQLTRITSPWSAEALISHELAHHWFGNIVTCRNLSTIWLNESFATFLMLLWDEESQGEDAYFYAVERAKEDYFAYVTKNHTIRSLEYHYFDDSNTIYNTEHTYYKGGVVLHMLRNILGDDSFFQALGYYLNKHEFSNVESHDLKIAFEETTGENLSWFFDDWVTGAGHPVFKVHYDYSIADKKLALYVEQTQPIVEGMDLFSLPVRIKVQTSTGSIEETFRIEEKHERFLIDCDDEPLMVSFDGQGDLVAEIDFMKSAKELSFQARNDAIPGRLRAIKQLASRYPNSPKTTETFSSLLNSEETWAIQAEAALKLGTVRTSQARNLLSRALSLPDYRVRKAAALALPNFGHDAISALHKLIDTDPHTDVVAAALLSLAKVEPALSPEYLKKQLARNSWYDEIKLAALRACGELGDKKLLSLVKKYAELKYNQSIHGAALSAWRAISPGDSQLHRKLISLTNGPVYTLQQNAIAMLGNLYVMDAEDRLEEIIAENAARNLVTTAQTALDKIRWFHNASQQ